MIRSKENYRHAGMAGLALFAMLFGSGNIIFPPYIGVVSGESWFSTFVAYFLTDIGLAILALVALLSSHTIDHFESIFCRLGDRASVIIMGAITIFVCTLVAPRTCTVSYEISILPTFGSSFPIWIYSIIFFIIVWIFCIKESKMIDYIGKILTPLLVLALVVMIIAGLVNPIGEVTAPKEDNLFYMGLISGYQTMDGLAMLVFNYVVAKNLSSKGFELIRHKVWAVRIVSVIVIALSFAVYGGMCYIGATASSLFDANVHHGELLRHIFSAVLGDTGAMVVGIAVLAACITTGIALTGSLATFLTKALKDRVPYNIIVTVLSLAYIFIANVGLSNIISIAVPFLIILYPAALTMIVLSLFDKRIENPNIFRVAVIFAIITSCFEVLMGKGFEMFSFVKNLPLQEDGFAWLVPAIIGAIIGKFIPSKDMGNHVRREDAEVRTEG